MNKVAKFFIIVLIFALLICGAIIGYKIYKDGSYLGFTEDNYFIISDEDDPFGTYKVVTSFEDYSGMDSSGATFTLDEGAAYTAEFLVPNARTYAIGSDIDSWDKNPSSSDIRLYKNGEALDDFRAIISIKNSNGDTVGNITTNTTEVYTITYRITYDSEDVATISRKVTIE